MWKLFEAYKEDVFTNPFTNNDWVGKDATLVAREYPRVITMEGFECYVMDNTEVSYPDLTHYFENTEGRYQGYVPICSRIRREIRRNQIEMGMAGLANPSITQRLNSLTEKTETSNKQSIVIESSSKEEEEDNREAIDNLKE